MIVWHVMYNCMGVWMFHSLVLVFRSEGNRISSVRHLELQKNSASGLSSLCHPAYKVFLIHQIMNLFFFCMYELIGKYWWNATSAWHSIKMSTMVPWNMYNIWLTDFNATDSEIVSEIFLSTTSSLDRLHFCVSAFQYHTLAVFQAYVSSIYSPLDCLTRFAVLIVTSVSDVSHLKGKKIRSF